MIALPNGRASDTLLMKLAHAACIARRWHTEQCVTSRCEPVIKDWAKFGERPQREDRRQPLPTRQYANHFDPTEVTFAPTTVGQTRVHLVGHRFARVRCSAFEDFRIVVVQPLKTMIAIQRLDAR